MRASESMAFTGRLANVRGELRPVPADTRDQPPRRSDQQVLYQMSSQRPWFGPPATHPESPQETLFRAGHQFRDCPWSICSTGWTPNPGGVPAARPRHGIDLRKLKTLRSSGPAWESAISPNRRYAVANRLGRAATDRRTGEKALRQLRDTINSLGAGQRELKLGIYSPPDLRSIEPAGSNTNAKLGQDQVFNDG